MVRIAVYITGHLRTFDRTWPQYRLLLKSLPVDIYIVLWDVRDTTDPTPVTEADVRAICPQATLVQILPSSTPLSVGHARTTAMSGQLYGLYRALQEMPQTYDWYLRMRTDLYFVDLECLSRIDFTAKDVDLWLPERIWNVDPNYPARDDFNDYLWIGTRAASAYLADAYTLPTESAPPYLERLLGEHLRKSSFRIRHFPGEFNLERRTRGCDMSAPESQRLTPARALYEETHPRGFYINLDTRTDRREQFEPECDRMNLVVERFPACRDITPAHGCSRSHLSVLKLARDRKLPAVLIFEDDFEFLVPKETVDDIFAHLPPDYDIVMLSYNLLQSEPYDDRFVRVLDAQTTSGYLVHARFYDRLIATLEEGYAMFLQHPHVHWLYTIDQFWKVLQPVSRWYATRTRIGKQRAGWSDLGQKFVDSQV